MRIENVRRGDTELATRTVATVVWEDSERPPLDLYFETDRALGDGLATEPGPFLVAAYLPAAFHGERRLAIDGPVSAALRAGLPAVSMLHSAWYGDAPGPALESRRGWAALYPRTPPRASSFLSGGIDSLFTLHRNRQEIPRDHPASFRDVVWLQDVRSSGPDSAPEDPPAARRRRKRLEEVAREIDATLVPLRTNVRSLEPSDLFYGYRFQTAFTASAAHALAPRADSVSVSSGWDIAHLIPWGTHPLCDAQLSTEAVTIRHEGLRFGRAEKLRRIARWDTAIRTLSVCNDVLPGPELNCGRCFKCVETMTLLLSEGLLDRTEEFPSRDVSPEMIRGLTLAPNLRSSFAEYETFWVAMIPGLSQQGRDDLVGAIGDKLGEAQRHARALAERDWKGRLRRLDRAVTRGLGLRLLRRARGRGI